MLANSIVAAGVDHCFGEGDAHKQMLFGVDLTLERGSLTILLGASGSGKTTLLTLLGCLRRLQAGSIDLLGTELAGASEDMLVRCRRRLGFIFQAHNLHESLTATRMSGSDLTSTGAARDPTGSGRRPIF